VIDSDRKVIAWNRAIAEMTGVGKDEMIFKGDYAYAVPFYGEPRPILIDLVLDYDISMSLKYEYLEKNNTTIYGEAYTPCAYQGRGAWLFATASPLFDDAGNVIGAIESIRDITDRKQIEDELKKHRDHLLDNAWKFTGKKASAEISFGITINEGRQVYFIRDNGAGFNMAHANKLFEPFKRLHSVKEFTGAGIGLASVKRIIRRHGGQIWAEGEVGQGATFYFTLQSEREDE
jgi:signal transduction histidine kinase